MKVVVDSSNSEKYEWAEKCIGWHLLKSEQLSVIQECVDPGKNEKRHIHKQGKQFFFILSGEAILEIEGTEYHLSALQGIAVEPLERHQFKNTSNSIVEFLVITTPKLANDRSDLE